MILKIMFKDKKLDNFLIDNKKYLAAFNSEIIDYEISKQIISAIINDKKLCDIYFKYIDDYIDATSISGRSGEESKYLPLMEKNKEYFTNYYSNLYERQFVEQINSLPNEWKDMI
jgi:hypothetical protein